MKKTRSGNAARDIPGDSRPVTPPQLRYNRPSSARFIARVAIKHAMDFDAAVDEITHHWGLTAAQVADLAEKCEQSEHVQAAIKDEFAKAGLGEDAKNEFLTTMRAWLFTGIESERLKAASIFGKGFVGEKVTSDKPVTLPLEGVIEGMTRMLHTDDEEEINAVAPVETELETETVQ